MDGPLLSLKELNRLRTVAWDDGWTPLINFQIISLTVTEIGEPLALRQCDVFALASDINQGVWSKCMINRIPLCSSPPTPPVSYPSTSFLYLIPHFLQFLKKVGCSPYILPLNPPIENWGCLGCFYCCKYKYIQCITDWKASNN